MGFGHSVQTMINTLRANKKLLPKRIRYFERGKDFEALKTTYRRHTAKLGGDQKASPEQLALIRQRVLEDLRSDRRKLIWSISGVLVLLSCLAYFSWPTNTPTSSPTKLKIEESELEYKFREYMNRGMIQLNQEKWFFAAGNFEEAVSLYPNSSEATYYLCYTYVKLCQENERSCEKAQDLISKALQSFPNHKRIGALKSQI